jgi:tetratricopeptide (TPR) repeat protein
MKPTLAETLNCQEPFEFQCPKSWNSMTQTNDSSIRYCEVCSKNVHMCLTPDEFISNGKLGRCVAIPEEILPGEPVVFAGRPSKKTLEQAINKQRIQWWDKALAEGSLSFPKFTDKDFYTLALDYIILQNFKHIETVVDLLSDDIGVFRISVALGEYFLDNNQIELAEKYLIKIHNLLNQEIDINNTLPALLSLHYLLISKKQVALSIEHLSRTYYFLERKDFRGERGVSDFLIYYGSYLIEQHQIDLARTFSLKAYALLKITNRTYEQLISNLIEVDCFDEALESARLFEDKNLHKSFLDKIHDRLIEKGEPLEAQRFIDLIC